MKIRLSELALYKMSEKDVENYLISIGFNKNAAVKATRVENDTKVEFEQIGTMQDGGIELFTVSDK